MPAAIRHWAHCPSPPTSPPDQAQGKMADDQLKQMLDAFENLSEEEFGYAKDEFDDIDTDG